MTNFSLRLMRGSTLLGVLTPSGNDGPWIFCSFTAAPAWEAVRSLFESWTAALESDDPDGARTAPALKAVRDLGTTLVPANGGPVIQDFLLHVRGDSAMYRHVVRRSH